METPNSLVVEPPIWKICSSNWITSAGIRVKHIWHHHLQKVKNYNKLTWVVPLPGNSQFQDFVWFCHILRLGETFLYHWNRGRTQMFHNFCTNFPKIHMKPLQPPRSWLSVLWFFPLFPVVKQLLNHKLPSSTGFSRPGDLVAINRFQIVTQGFPDWRFKPIGKNMSQNGNLPQFSVVKIEKIWNFTTYPPGN